LILKSLFPPLVQPTIQCCFRCARTKLQKLTTVPRQRRGRAATWRAAHRAARRPPRGTRPAPPGSRCATVTPDTITPHPRHITTATHGHGFKVYLIRPGHTTPSHVTATHDHDYQMSRRDAPGRSRRAPARSVRPAASCWPPRPPRLGPSPAAPARTHGPPPHQTRAAALMTTHTHQPYVIALVASCSRWGAHTKHRPLVAQNHHHPDDIVSC
jgi:hypothetical protein